METMQKEYEKIAQEVAALNDKFIDLKSTKASVNRRYKGCHILLSPLNYQPDIMAIGINPGGNTNTIKLDPYRENAYNYGFRLAKETRKVLSLAGLPVDKHWLDNNMVKTNHHYFATRNVKSLHALYGNVKWSEVNPHNKANDWTKRLIQIVDPKIILCEGAEAYYGVYQALMNKECPVKVNTDVWSHELQGYTVIGYKRTFSRIINKTELAACIKKHFNEATITNELL